MENTELTEKKSLNILLTAGMSDLGQALTRKLTSVGHRVYASVDGNESAKHIRKVGGIPVFIDTTRASEIASSLKMAKADVAINLDTQMYNAPPFRANRWDAEHVVASAQAMAEGAQSVGAVYVIHISPAFVYKDSTEAVDEHGKLRSVGDHPIVTAALKAEKAIKASGVKSLIIRAGYTYGENSEDLRDMKKTILAARSVPSSDKPASWIYVGDLAEAVRLACEVQPEVTILNVVDDTHASPNDFLGTFSQAIGIGKVQGGSGFMSALMGNRIAASLVDLSTTVNNETAKSTLGWQPKYSDHESAIEQLLISWRAMESA